MSKEGITVSTFQRAEDISILPRIFLREAFRVARTFLVEEPFRPVLRTHHPALGPLVTGPVPSLLGYVAACEKPAAQHVLGTHREEPLLSVWHIGAGKAAAFTSDAKNRWAREWMPWNGYAGFWPSLVRWCLRDGGGDELALKAESDGDRVHLTLDALAKGGEFENGAFPRGALSCSDGSRRDLRFEQTAPARYEAEEKAVPMVRRSRQPFSTERMEKSVRHWRTR